MAVSNTPVGYTSTIELFGDSLVAGSGGSGQNLATVLAAYYPTRLVNNWGIAGQTAQQIAARQGGSPVTVAVTGGSIGANFASTAATPSVQLLSTPADNTSRYLSGTIAGNPVTLSRAASGGPASTTETYTIMSAGNAAAVAPPSWAPFIPDQGANARDSLQVLWLGRNNVGVDLANVPGLVAQCAAYVHDPKRVIVIGILAALEDTTGTANATSINTQNATLASTYGANFVPATPPTAAEMTAVGYTPTSQDNTDISNGVWPTGLRSDVTTPHVHLTGPGYQIFANRVKAVIDANGW